MAKKPKLGSDPLQEDPLAFIKDSRPDKQNTQAQPRVITKSSQLGTKEGYTRATFIVREDYLEKIKAISYWERREIKKVIEEALRNYLDGKKVKSLPPKGD